MASVIELIDILNKLSRFSPFITPLISHANKTDTGATIEIVNIKAQNKKANHFKFPRSEILPGLFEPDVDL